MNRTNQKNYAQAAAQPRNKQASHTNNPHHQNQHHHHQQGSQQNQASGPSTSSNFSSSANGKPINNSQTKPQTQHNSTMGNGNTIKKNPVLLPKNGHAWESGPTNISFGSINTSNTPNAQISSLPPSTGQTLTSGGGLPTTLPTKGVPTFGSLPTNNTTTPTTPTTQATQATSTTVGNSGPGVNNINNNNNNNNSNGTPKTISAQIPRTHSAPPQLFQDSNNRNIGQSGHTPNVVPARSQPNNIQPAPALVNNPPLNNRKDSVSSTVSSNDGQSSFHPHHTTHHPNNHPNHMNQQHGHSHYRQHHHNGHKTNIIQSNIYPQRPPRDNKSVPHPSPHLNPAQQPVPPQQGAIPIPPIYSIYPYNYPPYPPPVHHYMPYVTQQRPPQMSQAHIPQVNNNVSFQKQSKSSKAIEIINPVNKAPIQFNNLQQQQQSPKNSNYKREEAPPSTSDKKLEESDKERHSSAVPIVNPAEKDKEERERKEREEREEAERLAKEKEEKERKEREERERKEREEREEQERLEKEKAEQERKEREEQERLAKEKEEQERKEREERERKEREEQERLVKEKEERERKEREEHERKEREERERKGREERERKEREERERKEREERERKEREERERKEREERERKEREERERKEREERERKEREERERKEREEQERLAKEKEEQERKEREERERKEREEREEQERLAKEKEERERKEREEREEQERLAKEKEELERKEKEEKERLEAERIEKSRKETEEKALKEQEKERQEVEKKKEEEETKTTAEESEKKESETSDKKEEKKEEKKFNKGHRPGPLDLSRTTSAPAIPSAPLSALGSARIIDDLNSVQYPPHIKSPNPELNSNAEPGKFKYDRNFLMQFMGVCKEKPENLPALEAIDVNEPKEDKKRATRTNSGPRATHKGSPNQTQFTNMGEFKIVPKTSDERFAASLPLRNGTSSTSFLGKFGRTGSGSTLLPTPGAMSSTANPPSPGRPPSSGRRDTNRRSTKSTHQMQGPNIGQDHVAPLERSENRWVPQIFNPLSKSTEESIPIESLQRKVKALLNKLTLEKFDSISDQIIDYANKSRDERDGRILKEVIRLIFEKSCDESNFCAMYAQLCRKMMEKVDPEIVDENVKNTEGKFVQGGTLFRKYLLNRCQEEFEKGWKVNIPLPSNEKGEPDLMSDEYYAAAKAKRQGLGLIRFIGELFKLNMLTERIMHECIKKLLIFQGSPEEEEMESLCKLMNTVGEQLDHVKPNSHEQLKSTQIDHAKAKKYMETYFERMDEISKLPNLSSRIKFMLMDVIDLRSNSWKPRRDVNAPKTIAEIHEDAAKQKEEAEYLRRSTSSGGRGMPKMAEQMSRSGSGRRERTDKGTTPHGSSASSVNDGWSTVGGNSSQRNKDKVGDLTKFGSVTRSKIGNNVSLSPGGILGSLSGGAKGWNTRNDSKGEDKPSPPSRTNSTTNMYSVLTSDSSEGRKSSELTSLETQKPSPPTERKKLTLLPRSKGITSEEPAKPVSKPTSEAAMSKELVEKRIDNMTEEYFSVWDVREVTLCLKEIPSEYHLKAIESFANKVIEKKQKDVDNVMKLFKEIVSSRTCDTDTFKDGFKATLEFLMDIGADAPMAYSFTGQLLYSAGLDFRDITELLKPLDDDKAIEKIVKGYTSALKNDVDEQTYVQKINDQKKSKDDINKYIEDLGGSSKK